jgi:hypothetical protein
MFYPYTLEEKVKKIHLARHGQDGVLCFLECKSALHTLEIEHSGLENHHKQHTNAWIISNMDRVKTVSLSGVLLPCDTHKVQVEGPFYMLNDDTSEGVIEVHLETAHQVLYISCVWVKQEVLSSISVALSSIHEPGRIKVLKKYQSSDLPRHSLAAAPRASCLSSCLLSKAVAAPEMSASLSNS